MKGNLGRMHMIMSALGLTLVLTMISRSMAFCSRSLLMAASEIQRLLVLKILNLDTDLNSSTWALGT